MRVDLPLCNLKTCRYSFDGNCISKTMYEQCEYTLAKEERPHGEWEWKSPTPKTIMTPHCSNCGHMNDFLMETNYCPNCGADMRPRILYEADDGAGKGGNVKEGETDIQKAWRIGFEKR